jgi:ribosomal protein L37AE/L43A
MSKVPNFASNLKYWRLINKLVFGKDVCCPNCGRLLTENYRVGYLWCSHCRKKYRATAWKGSWLYGMKLKPRQLFILLLVLANQEKYRGDNPQGSS